MARRKAKIVEKVSISGIADRGKAVGRDSEGQVYFIDGAVPGDLIDAFIYKKKKGVGQGSIHRMIEPSPDRQDAFCEHFSLCGGCKWQNLSYKRQIIEKEKVVRDAFDRIAKVPVKEYFPILGAERNSYYRNKMEYTFSTRRWVPQEELDTKEEVSFGPAVGFHRAGSFDKVVEVKTCHLQDDYGNFIRTTINNFIQDHQLSYYNIRDDHGFIRNLILRNNRAGDWMVNVIVGENDRENLNALLDHLLKKAPKIKSLWFTINEKKNDTITDLDINLYYGDAFLIESIGEVRFKIGPKSFFQTNSYQAYHLFQTVVDFAEFKGTENVYDLYTGLGSIALFLADKCKQVVGIEEIPEAILDAKENMKLNNIGNAIFYAGDVKDVLTDEFKTEHGKPDLIITDPPRAGMHPNVVDMFLKLEAPKIIYVSCNPATQARDIKLLSEKYDLLKLRPVDMFPHTHHIESVALLKLKHG